MSARGHRTAESETKAGSETKAVTDTTRGNGAGPGNGIASGSGTTPGTDTAKEAVTAALGEYIQRRKQVRILEAFGSFEFDPGYDYKTERSGRRSGRQGKPRT